MKKIVIVNFNLNSPGIYFIVNELFRVLNQRGRIVKIINKIPTKEEVSEALLIPYGPKETYLLLKAGFHCELSLMVDYYSMGLKNKCIFYLRERKIWNKDLWKSMTAYFLYYYREKYIFSHVKNFMFVSQYDIDKIKKRFPSNNYFFVPNGTNSPTIGEKTKSNKIRLGILSNWTQTTLNECKWFIEGPLKKIKKEFQNIELVVAGKGASNPIIKYFSSNPTIRFMGEVKNLDDFFSNIDIYVATVPKGCGILNKVLDAFIYKTLVIGIKQSFSGFSNLDKAYIICNNDRDYLNAINIYKKNPKVVYEYIGNAYKYISENNQWDKNYNIFIDDLIKFNII